MHVHVKCRAVLYCWSYCLWNACGIPGRPSKTWSLHIEDGAVTALVPHKRPSCCGVLSVSLSRAPAVLTRHLCASPLVNGGFSTAVCPSWCTEVGGTRWCWRHSALPPSLKLHLLLIQPLNKDCLAAPTHLHCSRCSEKSRLDWNYRGSSHFPRNGTGNAPYIQAVDTVKHVLFSLPAFPLLCLVWSSCTQISHVSFPVFSLKIHRTDVAVSWVIFKFPREKRGEKVETCCFQWGRGTSEGATELSTAWIVYTESILLIVSWHYILFC